MKTNGESIHELWWTSNEISGKGELRKRRGVKNQGIIFFPSEWPKYMYDHLERAYEVPCWIIVFNNLHQLHPWSISEDGE